MNNALATPSHRAGHGVYVYDLEAMPWRETPRGSVKEKAVRRDPQAGLFLGLVAFDPMSRSGVHQHLATATSYFLSGALTDYQGTTGQGTIGINLAGATHDAVSYPGCVLASRLEGPVVIPSGHLAIHPHAGEAVLHNKNPEIPPDISVDLASAVPVPTRFAGILRRPLFDYAGTGTTRRLCALTLWPGMAPIMVKHAGLTDWFVIAGDVRVNGAVTSGPSFIVIEPQAEVQLFSQFGCTLLAWAEGPACDTQNGAHELYGF
jgi:ChrR Cupin-like domain